MGYCNGRGKKTLVDCDLPFFPALHHYQAKVLTNKFKIIAIVAEGEVDILRVTGDLNHLCLPLVGLNLTAAVDKGRVPV